jgi:hypothetical protein
MRLEQELKRSVQLFRSYFLRLSRDAPSDRVPGSRSVHNEATYSLWEDLCSPAAEPPGRKSKDFRALNRGSNQGKGRQRDQQSPVQ